MSQIPSDLLKTTFQYLGLSGVCPHPLHDDFVSWTTKIVTGLLAVFPSYYSLFSISMIYENEEDITAFLLVCSSLIELINFLAELLCPIFKSTELVKFFQIMDEAYETISSLGIVQTSSPSHGVQRWFLSLYLVFPTVSLISLALTAPELELYIVASATLMLVLNLATLVKLKLMLLLLENKFEILNNGFRLASYDTLGIASGKGSDLDGGLFKLQNTKFVKPKTNGSGISVDTILKFNKAHFQLCDAHQTLNGILSFTSLTIPLIFSFFIIKACVIFGTTRNLLINVFIAYTGILLTVLFISTLSSATNVKINALKTKYLVHELLNEELPFDLEEECQLFSHVLVHRKIDLSAMGFFSLDLKLLTKILCTLAPMVLILVQRKNRAAKD